MKYICLPAIVMDNAHQLDILVTISYKLGDIVEEKDFDGVTYDFEIDLITEHLIYLKRLRVNEVFYSYVVSQHDIYNKKGLLS